MSSREEDNFNKPYLLKEEVEFVEVELRGKIVGNKLLFLGVLGLGGRTSSIWGGCNQLTVRMEIVRLTLAMKILRESN